MWQHKHAQKLLCIANYVGNISRTNITSDLEKVPKFPKPKVQKPKLQLVGTNAHIFFYKVKKKFRAHLLCINQLNFLSVVIFTAILPQWKKRSHNVQNLVEIENIPFFGCVFCQHNFANFKNYHKRRLPYLLIFNVCIC